HGVQIVFNDLFNQKTPRALAAFVNEKGEEGEATATKAEESSVKDEAAAAANPELAALNAELKKNTLEAFLGGERQPVGDVLLTGATGYLGMHILNELLTTHDGHIYCPLRVKGGEDPMRRLKTMYFYYFGDAEAFSRFDERVTPFAAEVTQPGALDSLDCKGLTVVNCVANVKHFSAGNDIELVNIESVRQLIDFCLRTGSRLIHISTTSIAGLSVDGVPGPDVKLTEQDLWLGQNIDANKYVYSKFKAEELVLDAIYHNGLDAKIMRVGNLSARQKDGEFQINFNTNNFLALLRAYVIIGMVPYDALSQTFEFSPIDDVAHAIMLLATSPKDCTVFHPYNIHHPYFADILNGFADAGITLKRVEREEFQEALQQMMDNPDLVTLLRPLMAYNLSTTHQMRWIEPENTYTTQVLFRYGFQWPTTNRNYVHRFVDTITGFDYFNS
ncbi:MAG: SDR family oxidoreductase, partial [Bacteroidaceae bacterium]|nr:SDR family oxidoreductase [Bacteroidaceae bacterium]